MKKDNEKGKEPMAGNYIRFDWAMKRLLRNKANFVIIEGLLTTLLNEKIVIQKLLEVENNKEDQSNNYFRVDMFVKNSKGEMILIELQNNNEYAYFQRILFETSNLVAEYINKGEGHYKIQKVYCINILYFSLGNGNDTIYHGKKELKGIHNNDVLELFPFQKQAFKVDNNQHYPEYYILKVNGFNQIANNPLEEWIYYLNTCNISESASAPGLIEAREQLRLDKMTKVELAAYYRYLDNLVILKDNIIAGREERRAKNYEIGWKEGCEEATKRVVHNMKSLHISSEIISQVTNLSIEEMQNL